MIVSIIDRNTIQEKNVSKDIEKELFFSLAIH